MVVEALPPVDTAKFDDVDSLLAECRKQMQETYVRLNAEVNAEINNNSKMINGYVKQNGFCKHSVSNST